MTDTAGETPLSWHLKSGTALNREAPDTFRIPSDERKAAVRTGHSVKLAFELDNPPHGHPPGERMWVIVTAIEGENLRGFLDNAPVVVPLLPGDEVNFTPDHIIDIWDTSNAGENAMRAFNARQVPGGIAVVCEHCNESHSHG